MTPAASSDEDIRATLVIRTWSDASMPGTLRARLLTTAPGGDPVTWSTAAGDAAIAQDVLRWLRDVRGQAPGGPPPPAPSAGPVGLDRAEGSGEADSAWERGLPPVLVDPAWVEAHLDDPDVVLVDVDDASDRYSTGHLPRAVRVHWDDDLHHPTQRGFLTAVRFADLMDRHGVQPHSRVVFYGDSLNTRAAWAHWCSTYHGHRRVSLLDGGRARWLAEGRPVTRTAHTRQPTHGYPVRPGRRDVLVTRDQVLAGLVGAPAGTALVDCRSAADFAGHPEQPYDAPTDRQRMVGRIPGAVHLPVEDLTDPATQQLLPVPELRRTVVHRGIDPDDQVTVYCGVGDRSALVWFVLHEVLAFPHVRCYTGAWAEYGSLTGVPTELDD